MTVNRFIQAVQFYKSPISLNGLFAIQFPYVIFFQTLGILVLLPLAGLRICLQNDIKL
jgi:hypothetical protein